MSLISVTEERATIEVPLLDLKAQYALIEPEIMSALQSVCNSQHFILGRHVKELEERIAAYCNCSFGIGVSSGSDALLVALMALQLGPGDEVITSTYSFFATAGAIARIGARPVFCDIDLETYNLSPAALNDLLGRIGETHNGQLVNRKTGGAIKALIPVHLFGQMADIAPLMEIARRHGLYVVEDAAQAIGSEYEDGTRAGKMGDIGCFSFFPSKNLGAFGDGGMCTTNDATLAERLRLLRSHGSHPKYYHAAIGGNFRLDELQAAILLVKFQHLDRWTARRQKNASFYDEAFAAAGLAGCLSTPKRLSGYRHIYNQYILRTKKRDQLRNHLTRAGIGTEIYYPIPLHQQQCFSYLGYDKEDCIEAVRAAQETLAIPIYPELSDAQKKKVVDCIVEFFC